MADITMCVNKECAMKDKCYRYKAKPSNYQSYAIFEHDKYDKCWSFVEFVEHTRQHEDDSDV